MFYAVNADTLVYRFSINSFQNLPKSFYSLSA